MANKFCSERDYQSQADVEAAYPAAAEVIEVDSGWMVFETVTDAETWRNQE